jgi:hypothetical protein
MLIIRWMRLVDPSRRRKLRGRHASRRNARRTDQSATRGPDGPVQGSR